MASSGNFCTFNETYRGTTTLYDHVLSAGNTRMTQSNISGSNHACGAPGTHLFQSGKFYWEAYMPANQTGGSHLACGILNVGDGATKSGSSVGLGITAGDIGINPYNNVVKFSNVQTKDYTESAFSSGDILQVAVDADNGAIYFGKNNTFLGSSDPTSGSSKTGAGATWTPSSYAGGWAPSQGCQGGNGNAIYMNWGQDSTFAGARSAGGNADENGFGDFVYSPPSGYLALCSANLPTSSDIDPAQTDDNYPGKQFEAVIYTGDASTRTITVGFQPDLVITRGRSDASVCKVVDSTRGATKVLQTHQSSAESTDSSGVTAFGSTGYNLGSDAGYNNNTTTYVSWNWRANAGTEVSNSDGATTTSVQANTAAGFSIVDCPQYTPNSTFGHGLNSAPNFIIAKTYEQGAQWAVYHSGYDSGKIGYLNQNYAQFTSSIFNSTAPTSSVFSMGASYAGTGAIIAYCWHDVAGFQKFGTYEGNANANGPFVYTGFRPRMIIIKSADSADDWISIDTARSAFNVTNAGVAWNLSSTETTSNRECDIYSNGFKPRTSNTNLNKTGTTYIFAAWGDVPYKYNNTF